QYVAVEVEREILDRGAAAETAREQHLRGRKRRRRCARATRRCAARRCKLPRRRIEKFCAGETSIRPVRAARDQHVTRRGNRRPEIANCGRVAARGRTARDRIVCRRSVVGRRFDGLAVNASARRDQADQPDAAQRCQRNSCPSRAGMKLLLHAYLALRKLNCRQLNLSILRLISRSHGYQAFANARFEPGFEAKRAVHVNGSVLLRIDIKCLKLPRFPTKFSDRHARRTACQRGPARSLCEVSDCTLRALSAKSFSK